MEIIIIGFIPLRIKLPAYLEERAAYEWSRVTYYEIVDLQSCEMFWNVPIWGRSFVGKNTLLSSEFFSKVIHLL